MHVGVGTVSVCNVGCRLWLGEEYLVATVNGSFCGRGAGVGSEEAGPVVRSAKGWVLRVPTVFGRCGNAVSEEEPYLSIGTVIFVKDNDCVEAVCCFDDCAFLGYQGK